MGFSVEPNKITQSDINNLATTIDGLQQYQVVIQNEIDTKQTAFESPYAGYSVNVIDKKFVILGNEGITYSSDGITWQVAGPLPDLDNNGSISPTTVSNNGEKFIAFYYNAVKTAYSLNGKDWLSSNSTGYVQRSAISAHGNGQFLVVSDNWGTTTFISTDGITWTVGNQSSIAGSFYRDLIFGGNKFIALMYDGYIVTANSANSWNQATFLTYADGRWHALAYGNNKAIAICKNSNVVAYSSNLTSWSFSTLPSTQSWQTVAYGNGKFVAIASNTNIAAYSADGATWTQITLPSSQDWVKVKYGNEKFIAVSSSGQTYIYSIDGINWSEGVMPWSNDRRLFDYKEFNTTKTISQILGI